VLPGVFSGHVPLCLGYTEPEVGSDIATCKTRAVRDGDQWVVNGSQMFTTGAHNCQYVFLWWPPATRRRARSTSSGTSSRSTCPVLASQLLTAQQGGVTHRVVQWTTGNVGRRPTGPRG